MLQVGPLSLRRLIHTSMTLRIKSLSLKKKNEKFIVANLDLGIAGGNLIGRCKLLTTNLHDYKIL